MKNLRKNEKGFTLIELLAVIVILGIIAAIAVPSISNIIDNTKKDAHVANAQSMIDAAKLATISEKKILPVGNDNKTYITLRWLEENGYLETLVDPEGDSTTYEREETTDAYVPKAEEDDDEVLEAAEQLGDISYVVVEKVASQYKYSVYLKGSERTVIDYGADDAAGDDGDSENEDSEVLEEELERDFVKQN